jgi:hypothetical protein
VLAELLGDPAQRARLGAAGAAFVHEECAWGQAIEPLEALLAAQIRLPTSSGARADAVVAGASAR